MSSRNVVVGAVATVAIVAVAVVLLVVLRGGVDLALPDRLGDLPATNTAAAYPDADEERRVEVLERDAAGAEYNSDLFADALGGAAVTTRRYADFEAEDAPQVTVIATDTDLGPLLPLFAFVDPAAARLAAPTVERSVDGDDVCLLERRPIPESVDGEQPDSEDLAPFYVVCQRSTSSLSVRVISAVNPDLGQTRDLLDEAWDAVS